MTCNYRNSSGTDLDSIFYVDNSYEGAIGFKCSNGQDLGNRYPYGSLGYSVGYKNSAGTDLGYLRTRVIKPSANLSFRMLKSPSSFVDTCSWSWGEDYGSTSAYWATFEYSLTGISGTPYPSIDIEVYVANPTSTSNYTGWLVDGRWHNEVYCGSQGHKGGTMITFTPSGTKITTLSKTSGQFDIKTRELSNDLHCFIIARLSNSAGTTSIKSNSEYFNNY